MNEQKPYLVHDSDKQRQQLEAADPDKWEHVWNEQHAREQERYEKERAGRCRILAWVGVVAYLVILIGAVVIALLTQ